MKCTESREMLSAYADGEINGQRALDVQAHIEQCTSCKAEFEALAVIQSKLGEMMSEPMKGSDLADQVMASLPIHRKPVQHRLVCALAAAVFLLAIGVRLALAPNPAKHNAPQMVTNPLQPHGTVTLPAPKEPDQRSETEVVSAPVVSGSHEVQVARAPKVHRHRNIHAVKRQRVPDMRHPVQETISPEVYQMVVHHERIGARLETTMAVTARDTILCRAKLTTIDLPPNDYAAVTRPPLEVVKTDNADAMQINGG